MKGDVLSRVVDMGRNGVYSLIKEVMDSIRVIRLAPQFCCVIRRCSVRNGGKESHGYATRRNGSVRNYASQTVIVCARSELQETAVEIIGSLIRDIVNQERGG
jgi:hypothetical protein